MIQQWFNGLKIILNLRKNSNRRKKIIFRVIAWSTNYKAKGKKSCGTLHLITVEFDTYGSKGGGGLVNRGRHYKWKIKCRASSLKDDRSLPRGSKLVFVKRDFCWTNEQQPVITAITESHGEVDSIQTSLKLLFIPSSNNGMSRLSFSSVWNGLRSFAEYRTNNEISKMWHGGRMVQLQKWGRVCFTNAANGLNPPSPPPPPMGSRDLENLILHYTALCVYQLTEATP